MTSEFNPGDRVRHIDGREGVIESVDHDASQVFAPNTTCTVRWDGNPTPEPLVRREELKTLHLPDASPQSDAEKPNSSSPADKPTEPASDPAGDDSGGLPPGRRYDHTGPKPPYPIPGVD